MYIFVMLVVVASMLVAGNGNEAKILFTFNNCYYTTLERLHQNLKKKKKLEKITNMTKSNTEVNVTPLQQNI